MLHLITPITEAVASAKEHMPGLHEFLYDDALDCIETVWRERRFYIGSSWDERQTTLSAVAIGFIHGEAVALTDRRDETSLMMGMPMALIEHPVWSQVAQLVGEAPTSSASLATAMEYIADLESDPSDLSTIMWAVFVAYGIVMGYERGSELRKSETGLPLSPRGAAEFMSMTERLLATVTKSVAETERHHGAVLDALYGEDEMGRAQFLHACVHSTAEYVTNAVLSLAHRGHLLCSPGVVVGRVRAYASQFASGFVDGTLGVVDTGSLIQAMFAEDKMAEGSLCGEPMPVAIRNAALRICDVPLTDGMLPLAIARAWDLLDGYGEDWSGPVDIMPSGETIGGVPVFVLVDADERIAVSAIAYACGVRAAYEGGTHIPYARRVAAREAYEGRDEPAWEEVWDIEANSMLPAWHSVSVAHPIRGRAEVGADEEQISADGTENEVIASNDGDGQALGDAGPVETDCRRLCLV